MKKENIIVAMNRHVKSVCSKNVVVKKVSNIENALLKCTSHHAIVQLCAKAHMTEQETVTMLIQHSNQCRTLIVSALQAQQRIKRIMLSIKIANSELSNDDTYRRRCAKRTLKINSF